MPADSLWSVVHEYPITGVVTDFTDIFEIFFFLQYAAAVLTCALQRRGRTALQLRAHSWFSPAGRRVREEDDSR